MQDKTSAELFETLLDTVGKLGWNMAIPTTKDEEEVVPGLVIGTQDYIDKVLRGEYNQDEEKK
jgi:hypothetical protein